MVVSEKRKSKKVDGFMSDRSIPYTTRQRMAGERVKKKLEEED